jgi:hypothetical protein
VRYGRKAQPAISVRGSSRRIMFLRFRPAHISMINRRVSSSAVLGTAVHAGSSRLTNGMPFPPSHPSQPTASATTVLAGKGALRSLTGPLPAPRRCGRMQTRWAAPAGHCAVPFGPAKKERDMSLHISCPTPSPQDRLPENPPAPSAPPISTPPFLEGRKHRALVQLRLGSRCRRTLGSPRYIDVVISRQPGLVHQMTIPHQSRKPAQKPLNRHVLDPDRIRAEI